MFEVRQLSVCIEEQELIKNFNLQVNSGHCIFLRGENGVGKTTLLKTLVGLKKSSRGEIYWDSQLISEHSQDFLAHLHYLAHQLGLSQGLTVNEHWNFWCNKSTQSSDKALAYFNLTAEKDVLVGDLSQGQSKRVALMRLLTDIRKIWVLDEPFSHLDRWSVELLKTMIIRHCHFGGLVIYTSHQALRWNNFEVFEKVL